tara:strand:- start:795 stop:1403 length:609 start_codon:yes stop_codon:yes gene_type:complete
METINKYIKYLPWVIAAILAILMVRGCGNTPEKEYITVETIVEVPSVEKVFDTIYEPQPYPVKVKEIDSTYYKKYTDLKTQVEKDSLFKEAIEVNEYNETFEDTLQTINVYSKTRGKLLEQNVKYTTKPYYITVKDSVELKNRTVFSIGAEVGVPTIPTLSTSPVLKGNAIITNKRGNSISISYDTEGRVWVGKTWKIRLRK